MQQLKIVGTTPLNRVNYEVLGEHREMSLLEFVMVGMEIVSAVISIGDGKHKHITARGLINYIESGNTIHGLTIGAGHKLALTSSMGKRQIERNCYNPDRIYSCCLDESEALLIGVFITTYTDTVAGLPVATSVVTGYRFCMMQNILELSPEETAEWLLRVHIPELSVVNGNVYINDQSIVSKIYTRNSYVTTGTSYIELVLPEDVVYVKQS